MKATRSIVAAKREIARRAAIKLDRSAPRFSSEHAAYLRGRRSGLETALKLLASVVRVEPLKGGA